MSFIGKWWLGTDIGFKLVVLACLLLGVPAGIGMWSESQTRKPEVYKYQDLGVGVYFEDRETDLCFVVWGIGSHRTVTNVPCNEKVRAKIVN